MINKAKHWIGQFLVTLCLMVLLLYGFEYFFDPRSDLPVNGKVNGERYTWGHLVRNNRYDFRERDFRVPKPPDVYRVMVLGDSLTWGAGLAIEQRYTAIAERLLQEAFPKKRFEVLNFGIRGGPTTAERDILQEYKDIVQPNMIVVGFCLNDPQPKSQDYSVEREELDKGFGAHVRRVSRWLRKAGLRYTGEVTREGFYRFAEVVGAIPRWYISLNRTYEKSSSEWREFVRALRQIREMSDQMNLPRPLFAVLNQGTYRDRPTNYAQPDEAVNRLLRWYHQAEQAMEQAGLTVYNHEKEIASQLNNEPLTINALDGHPSANLNILYGEKLFRKIADLIQKEERVHAEGFHHREGFRNREISRRSGEEDEWGALRFAEQGVGLAVAG